MGRWGRGRQAGQQVELGSVEDAAEIVGEVRAGGKVEMKVWVRVEVK